MEVLWTQHEQAQQDAETQENDGGHVFHDGGVEDTGEDNEDTYQEPDAEKDAFLFHDADVEESAVIPKPQVCWSRRQWMRLSWY